MSFLSDLVHTVNKISDPIGDNIRDKVSPQYNADDPTSIIKKDSTVATTPQTSQDALAQGAGYYGDPNDPSYGSFTKPFDVQSFYANMDPSYFFRLQQGQQAVVNGNAAGSGALSGSAMKDLMNYNQNAASQEYGNAYNRYQTTQGNIFSRLAEMAGLGQNAAAGTGANGVALAGQAGQATQNAGSAAGAGIVGGANALTSGLNNYAGYQYANQPRQWSGGNNGVAISP